MLIQIRELLFPAAILSSFSSPGARSTPARGRNYGLSAACLFATSLIGGALDALMNLSPSGGHLANKPENMERWIRDRQHVAPGTAMPDFRVGKADARDITAFRYTRAE